MSTADHATAETASAASPVRLLAEVQSRHFPTAEIDLPSDDAAHAFARVAPRVLSDGLRAAVSLGDLETEFRPAVCRWEDELFARYPAALETLTETAAAALLAEVFEACGRPAPALQLVEGFTDPLVGGYADVGNHAILIERGCIYRCLLLHEAAHLLVPDDRRHGPAFTYVVQCLYRHYLHIPDSVIAESLRRHGLPDYTHLPD